VRASYKYQIFMAYHSKVDNNRKLYKRKCDFTGKKIISIFNEKSPYKVYEQNIWWSDKWNPMEYGKNYDMYSEESFLPEKLKNKKYYTKK